MLPSAATTEGDEEIVGGNGTQRNRPQQFRRRIAPLPEPTLADKVGLSILVIVVILGLVSLYYFYVYKPHYDAKLAKQESSTSSKATTRGAPTGAGDVDTRFLDEKMSKEEWIGNCTKYICVHAPKEFQEQCINPVCTEKATNCQEWSDFTCVLDQQPFQKMPNKTAMCNAKRPWYCRCVFENKVDRHEDEYAKCNPFKLEARPRPGETEVATVAAILEGDETDFGSDCGTYICAHAPKGVEGACNGTCTSSGVSDCSSWSEFTCSLDPRPYADKTVCNAKRADVCKCTIAKKITDPAVKEKECPDDGPATASLTATSQVPQGPMSFGDACGAYICPFAPKGFEDACKGTCKGPGVSDCKTWVAFTCFDPRPYANAEECKVKRAINCQCMIDKKVVDESIKESECPVADG